MSLKNPREPIKRLREKLASRALYEPEFQGALNDALHEIRSEAKKAPNEATIESAFERVLYALLKDIGIPFSPEKESAVATKRHIGRGRADSRIGAFIIEFKHRSALKTQLDKDKATRQLSEYLIPISETVESEIRGVVTDGIGYCELSAQKGAIVAFSGHQPLSKDALFRIVLAIYSLRLTALSPQNLIRDFARPDYEGGIFESARVLEKQLASARESDKTKMLRLEWEGLFKLAHDDQSQQRRIIERRKILSQIFRIGIGNAEAEYRALFCLHTAYAITLKLMAFRVVCDLHFGSRAYNFKDFQGADDPGLRAFCERLEDGEVFRDLGFLNLLEGDFFSWYSDKSQWTPQVAESIRGLLTILARYEDVKSVFTTTDALDLFRELYEACVPQVVRASFGEFHTPYWLAVKVLEEARPSSTWTMLDPCCGSGTFVIAAIARLRGELRGQTQEVVLENILNRVCGFDLNPLSVLATRVNYFIHISDLLPDTLQDLVIPVYLGDASYVPETTYIDGVRCLSYRLRTLKGDLDISLPASAINNIASFIKTMREVENDIRAIEPESAVKLLIESTPSADRKPGIIDVVNSMCSQLANLEKNGWNGIWARILSNFLATACLPKFTCIVGNPPWIDWKNLPAGYREKIKSLCIDRGLFSGAGRTGGINLNVCALIANVTSVNWLDSNGHLAFLMPSELSYQSSYEGWRKKGPGPGRTIIELHDWSEAGHPFDPVKEDFMTYVIGPTPESPGAIPVMRYRKTKDARTSAKSWKTVSEADANLEVTQSFARAIIPKSSALTIAQSEADLAKMSLVAGVCEYIGREGIEFYPQELLLFRYVGKGLRPNLVNVENLQIQKSKHRVPLRRRLLETEYLFPLVKGPNIEPFHLSDAQLLVPFPYESKDPAHPIEEKILRRRAKLLFEYYRAHKEIIDAQTKFSDKIRGANPGAYYGLARVGPYSFRDTYVAFRDNTKWCACVVGRTKTSWGISKRMVFQNHAVSISERASGKGYITRDEAHYICAVLNAPSVEKFILQSSDNRSFKIRPPVYLPQYNSTNTQHKKLSQLSKLAHNGHSNVGNIRRQIDEIYLRLCRDRKVN